MKESLQNIGNIIAEPSTAFLKLKSEPRSYLPPEHRNYERELAKSH